MSNIIIMWSMFLIPWLTLIFMKKEDIKRYMPVGLLAIVTTTIIYDVGTTLGFWTLRESFFPFNYMEPYFYGTIPVLTMWVFKFTEGRFWTYMLTNIILDIGFNFFLLNYFFPSRGIMDFNIPPLFSLPITLTHAAVLYGYQIWQNDMLFKSENNIAHIQPAAAKPLNNLQDKEKDNY
ncbi:hypothetical protein SCACP_38290 [Sporomusa carbonis]|uniref:hypothetical protein n=1 Tax=Sporomusa carbonis TaxID=3076075 RepID=UPI003A792CEC